MQIEVLKEIGQETGGKLDRQQGLQGRGPGIDRQKDRIEACKGAIKGVGWDEFKMGVCRVYNLREYV